MRKLIENPVYMAYENMKEEFRGKWILITNCDFTQDQEFIGGIPVAVADTIYEGHKDGFYDKFDAPEYSPRADRDFDYDSIPGLLAFFDDTEMDGNDNAT